MKDIDMTYINKAHELIKGIPELKKEILDLREQLTVNYTEHNAKRLRFLTSLLKFFIDTLHKISLLGELLIDVYFNGMTRRALSEKYGYDPASIRRILKAETQESANSWITLSVYLFGAEAVRLEV